MNGQTQMSFGSQPTYQSTGADVNAPMVTGTPTYTAISQATAVSVKTQFAQATDVAGIARGLMNMVDALANTEPSQMRVNGRAVSPPQNRWRRQR